ncbi:syntaxin-16 [Drosophila grimshawi]|uniref:GH12082 n=1 Tax=Drosophila grimshawi TaxID=7222 RepID=B4JKB4_DROGR|nr:syntaxin-16 [Drosophila grimshawi]EDW00017.1 GH12082 [Drosophila grimshawi]
MTSRNLTEVFIIMRNNASKNRNHYDDRRGSDSERLLKHTVREAEEGLELQDEYGTPPVWLDKFEEAQYTMSKIKPKLDELGSLHARHLLRPTFDDQRDDECEIEVLSQIVAKLIASTHRHIQCVRSSLGMGSKVEQRLTANAVHCALLQLQDLTIKFRSSQNAYLLQLNSREERSQKYFDNNEFTNVELGGGHNDEPANFVDSFDNFLQPLDGSVIGRGKSTASTYIFEDDDQEIDDHFKKPVANRMTQQQLLLFEEENTRNAQHREQEVTKIVKSIYDLNDIFKDLGHMVQEQGTVLDRIDYNVEQTQTRVSEGLRQLQRAELYQRKNRKMCIILVLAVVTFLMLLLLILTKL